MRGVVPMKDLDKYRGCMLGGAIGDALGYPIEFSNEKSISKQYGKNGITEYELTDGVAQISDDTQMTMFTADGILRATTTKEMHGIMLEYPDYIMQSYQSWYKTQNVSYAKRDKYIKSWLQNIPELYSRRAPGITCLNAIQAYETGTRNNSKGCGGVMRVAPIGLFFEDSSFPDFYNIEEIDQIGADAAELTHHHELGFIPAAALVHIISLIAHNDKISLLDAVLDMKTAIQKQYEDAKHLKEFIAIIDDAITLSADEGISDLDAIHQLGEGWVAEEALAIAIYCSLKYSDDFEKGIIAAVNHKGDSDSTGAIAGNILGAYLGLKKIPEKYLQNLELKDIILELADDLYEQCPMQDVSDNFDEVWYSKYCKCTYKGK